MAFCIHPTLGWIWCLRNDTQWVILQKAPISIEHLHDSKQSWYVVQEPHRNIHRNIQAHRHTQTHRQTHAQTQSMSVHMKTSRLSGRIDGEELWPRVWWEKHIYGPRITAEWLLGLIYQFEMISRRVYEGCLDHDCYNRKKWPRVQLCMSMQFAILPFFSWIVSRSASSFTVIIVMLLLRAIYG